RHVHDVIEQGEKMPSAHPYSGHCSALFLVDRSIEAVFENRAVPVDRSEWTSNVVRERGQRAVLRIRRTFARPQSILERGPYLLAHARVLQRYGRLIGERREQ